MCVCVFLWLWGQTTYLLPRHTQYLADTDSAQLSVRALILVLITAFYLTERFPISLLDFVWGYLVFWSFSRRSYPERLTYSKYRDIAPRQLEWSALPKDITSFGTRTGNLQITRFPNRSATWLHQDIVGHSQKDGAFPSQHTQTQAHTWNRHSLYNSPWILRGGKCFFQDRKSVV